MDHQLLIDMIPAYALDCLSVEERDQMRLHLETCAACQAELRVYQEVVGQLAAAVPQRTPPSRLKHRIIQNTALKPGVQTGMRQPKRSWWEKLSQAFLPSTPVFQWVTLLAIVVLAAGNLFFWQKLNQAQSNLSQDFRTVDMVATSKAPGAGGVFIISADGHFGTLIADGMPGLKENQVFQLWLIKDGQRTNGGILAIKPGGYGTLVVKPGHSLLDYSSFGITIEPSGGSPAPTGDKVLGGNWQ